jgi:hypothetical protein
VLPAEERYVVEGGLGDQGSSERNTPWTTTTTDERNVKKAARPGGPGGSGAARARGLVQRRDSTPSATTPTHVMCPRFAVSARGPGNMHASLPCHHLAARHHLRLSAGTPGFRFPFSSARVSFHFHLAIAESCTCLQAAAIRTRTRRIVLSVITAFMLNLSV